MRVGAAMLPSLPLQALHDLQSLAVLGEQGQDASARAKRQ